VNIALVKKKEFTSIKRGENSGLKQTSYNIVYDFKSVMSNDLKQNLISFDFKNNWSVSDFMVIAYVQDNTNQHIIAATKMKIN